MPRSLQAPSIFFGIGIVGLGILSLVYGDFAEVWQPAAAWAAGRTALAYASGIVMLVGGLSLLFKRASEMSVRILFPFLIIGFLLQIPAPMRAPLVEVNWENAGEIGVLLAGAWVLFAARCQLGEGSRFAFAIGENGLRIGRVLFAVSLLPIGLSHFVYLKDTTGLVPAWLPFRTGWVYVAGAGHIAGGLGVLFSVVPRLAATMEAGMLGVFTLLVWIPRVVTAPTTRLPWQEFVISWTIAAGAWVVAESITPGAKDRR